MEHLAFKAKVEAALERVKLVLDTQKCCLDSAHGYEDLFALVERSTCLTLASHVNVLSLLGVPPGAGRLSFSARERCSWLREEVIEPADMVSYAGYVMGLTTAVKRQVWNFEVSYSLELDGNALWRHARSTEGAQRAEKVFDGELWMRLSEHLDESLCPSFKIDRGCRETRTPVRNGEVSKLSTYFQQVERFLEKILGYLKSLPDAVQVPANEILLPAVPFFVSAGDENLLLAEEMRSLSERRSELGEEAALVVTLQHALEVPRSWHDTIHYVEQLLYDKLALAIGHELCPADVRDYMRFHHRRLFSPGFQPRCCAWSVRRGPGYDIEGVVAVEEDGQAIHAMCSVGVQPMQFALNASTKVSFSPEIQLHGWLTQQFSGQATSALALRGRTRAFGAYLLLLGRLSSATEFQATHGLLLRHQDELEVPLRLSTLPSATEFKDAIESLSAEQRRFAKAFREMQLESSLFAVLLVQLKPQLERLLNLQHGSLEKEIQLTQDLCELFVRYQIPSDLLSFSQPGPASSTRRLEVVKAQVRDAKLMIQEAQAMEEREAEMQRELLRRKQAEDDVREKLKELRSTMQSNLDQILQRGECLDSLVAKTQQLSTCSQPFKQRADRAHRRPSAPPAASTTPVASATPVAPQPWTRCEAVPHAQGRDYTQVPRDLDQSLEALGCVRPTMITPGASWSKRSRTLLGKPKLETLLAEQQKREKDAAFELLDSLTRSGALPLQHSELHLLVVATQCFQRTVMDTVIQENVNPIEQLERSSLAIASSIHRLPPKALMP